MILKNVSRVKTNESPEEKDLLVHLTSQRQIHSLCAPASSILLEQTFVVLMLTLHFVTHLDSFTV